MLNFLNFLNLFLFFLKINSTVLNSRTVNNAITEIDRITGGINMSNIQRDFYNVLVDLRVPVLDYEREANRLDIATLENNKLTQELADLNARDNTITNNINANNIDPYMTTFDDLNRNIDIANGDLDIAKSQYNVSTLADKNICNDLISKKDKLFFEITKLESEINNDYNKKTKLIETYTSALVHTIKFDDDIKSKEKYVKDFFEFENNSIDIIDLYLKHKILKEKIDLLNKSFLDSKSAGENEELELERLKLECSKFKEEKERYDWLTERIKAYKKLKEALQIIEEQKQEKIQLEKLNEEKEALLAELVAQAEAKEKMIEEKKLKMYEAIKNQVPNQVEKMAAQIKITLKSKQDLLLKKLQIFELEKLKTAFKNLTSAILTVVTGFRMLISTVS